jgi:hypothetical protein
MLDNQFYKKLIDEFPDPLPPDDTDVKGDGGGPTQKAGDGH